QYTPPGVIQNSSIAYALRMAILGPFFVWGAKGDFWPAIVHSFFFGLGLYLLYVIRRPIFEFFDRALSRDQSITAHEFIAQQHGNDPRVRLFAAALTLFAVCGLIVGEAFGIAALLKPMGAESGWSPYLAVFAMLLLTVLYASLAGNSGVMQSAQLQLGMLYLGLFGSAGFPS